MEQLEFCQPIKWKWFELLRLTRQWVKFGQWSILFIFFISNAPIQGNFVSQSTEQNCKRQRWTILMGSRSCLRRIAWDRKFWFNREKMSLFFWRWPIFRSSTRSITKRHRLKNSRWAATSWSWHAAMANSTFTLDRRGLGIRILEVCRK